MNPEMARSNHTKQTNINKILLLLLLEVLSSAFSCKSREKRDFGAEERQDYADTDYYDEYSEYVDNYQDNLYQNLEDDFYQPEQNLAYELYKNCRPCDTSELKSVVSGAPCCPLPAGRVHPPSRSLHNYTHCGRQSISRIIGGDQAIENEFPWMCAIMRSDNRWRGCGAALLNCNPVVIVTAAHCVQGIKDPSEVRIACGAHNMMLKQPSPLDRNEVRLEVSEILTHPEYTDPAYSFDQEGPKIYRYLNDIAVIKVKNSLPCSSGVIYPVCVPNFGDSHVGTNGLLSGWGRTSWPRGKVSTTLKKIKLPIVDKEVCSKVCSVGLNILVRLAVQTCHLAHTQTCAGGFKGRGACQGDSGSALVSRDSDDAPWTIVGITSWSRGCALEGFPTVFTKISMYLPWISEQYGLQYTP